MASVIDSLRVRGSRFLLAMPLSFASEALANEILLVDSLTFGAPYATIQQAVNAASDGDILLIMTGSYGSFTIDGKSLTLMRHPSASSPSIGPSTIRNIAEHQKVVLRGLTFGSGFSEFSQLTIRDSTGPVFVEDVRLRAVAQNAQRVTFTRCTMQGASNPYPDPTPPATTPALRVLSANVTVYDSVLEGGHGAPAGVVPFTPNLAPSQAGSPAIDLISGKCLVAGSIATGGRGGWGYTNGVVCLPGSAGGAGIEVDGALTTFDSTIASGIDGGDPAPCPPGPLSPPSLVLGPIGAHHSILDALRRFEVTGPAWLGGTIHTRIEGAPGEVALLLLSLVPHGESVPALKGTLVGKPPLLVASLGVLPPTGVFEFETTLFGNLPPGFAGVEIYEQCVVAGASGTGLLSNPSITAILVP